MTLRVMAGELPQRCLRRGRGVTCRGTRAGAAAGQRKSATTEAALRPKAGLGRQTARRAEGGCTPPGPTTPKRAASPRKWRTLSKGRGTPGQLAPFDSQIDPHSQRPHEGEEEPGQQPAIPQAGRLCAKAQGQARKNAAPVPAGHFGQVREVVAGEAGKGGRGELRRERGRRKRGRGTGTSRSG